MQCIAAFVTFVLIIFRRHLQVEDVVARAKALLE